MERKEQQIKPGRPGRVFAWPQGAGRVCMLVALAGTPLAAWAADLRVRVMHRETGQSVQNVSVCLGTPADRSQLGAQRTPDDGTVVFRDVPRAPLVLTVSGSGYRPEERRFSSLDQGRVMVIQLAPGGGPSLGCEAPSGRRVRGFEVRGFRINGGAVSTSRRRVTLNFVVPEGVTAYRAGEAPDLADARWQDVRRAPAFELSPGSGRKTVYLQLRRTREVEGARLETRSEVVSDSIVLQ